MKIMRSGITFGIIAGLLTFLFGGWSVAIIGSLMGGGLGMGLGSGLERKEPLKIAKEVFPTALVAGAILTILSLYQNGFIQDAIGKRPAEINVVIFGNLIGFLGSVFFTTLLAGLHGLPEKEEQKWKMFLLAALVIAFPFIDKLTALRWTAQIICIDLRYSWPRPEYRSWICRFIGSWLCGLLRHRRLYNRYVVITGSWHTYQLLDRNLDRCSNGSSLGIYAGSTNLTIAR